MRILMLIPQAFYTTRGTPLSAYHRTKELERMGYTVDIMTYPVGDAPPALEGKVYRSWGPHFVSRIKQGPSKIKIWFDFLFASTLFFLLLWKFVTRRQYGIMYAHEAGGFIAAWLGGLFRIPYIYDMHSSLPLQIKEWKFSKSKAVLGVFEWVERFTVKHAHAVVSIAPGVTEAAEKAVPDCKVVTILNRFSLDERPTEEAARAIRERHNISPDKKLVLYTGSFVELQALDLLIECIPRVAAQLPDIFFLIVGGKPDQIVEHQKLVDQFGANEWVSLVEAKPQEEMPLYMAACDVLVSPRVRGINPPGKLFSYLNSGKPVVACDTLVHNQILDNSCSILTPPTVEGFADGVITAILDKPEIERVTKGAKEILNTKYSEAAREKAYHDLIQLIKQEY
jgi:glycosyltransferase involved in cell wall biosynthesis